MRRARILTTVGLALMGGLFAVRGVSADQLWQCQGPDGKTLYTDRTADYTHCREYNPTAKLSLTDKGLADVKLPVAPEPSESARPAEVPQAGRIDFGTFNRLAIGMTESEVLNLAGPPKATRLGSAWAYAMPDDSLVEVHFGTGRVVEIQWHRTTP
jgi:hypothetical protein